MTEEISRKYEDLDIWPTVQAIEAMYEGQLDAVLAVQPAIKDIANAVDVAVETLGETGRLIYVGAGTSGRLAVLDGSELGPTFGWPFNRIEFCMAGGLAALTQSQEGAEDSGEDGRAKISDVKACQNDVVFCVSASGKTPFSLGALKEARLRGALTIGIANNPDTPILMEADHGILAETKSEIVAGSTRMKAGTAQKIILNMLSTAIMTRLGHVYKGLMVDMVVSNAKLETRATNMVSDISGCSLSQARSALSETNNNIKKAALLCSGAGRADIEAILQEAHGNLRQAMSLVKASKP